MKAGEYIAGALAATGVRSVFAVAGASHAHLLDPLDRLGIRIVSSRHESGAVSEADGYARVSGGLGVALVIADQGLPNAIGGLAAAYHANSPVLLIAAATPASFTEAAGSVDAGKLQLVASLSKWSRLVTQAARIPDHLATALAQARAGRPGPVVLVIPADLLGATLDAPPPGRGSEPSMPQPDGWAIEAAAEMLARAHRPLAIAGAGAAWGQAGRGLTRLAHEAGIPVAGNGLGRGAVAEDWRRSFSWPYAQLAAREADCVLVVGSRLTQRMGFGLPPRFAPHARFIQIDVHAEEAHRNRPIDIFIHASAGAAVDALAETLVRRGGTAGRADWLAQALKPRHARVAELQAAAAAPIHPLRLGRLLAERMPADAVYVGDGADIQSWMYGAIAIRRERGFLDHYPMGAMGVGTPLAVGAAAALADAAGGVRPPPVVLVTGDGSLGFLPAELHAAARAGLRLVVIVGNDGAWGTEAEEQRRAIGRKLNTELGVLPYERVAEGFGCLGLRAETEAELQFALDRAFAAEGPVLVNVVIDPAAGAQLKQDPLLRMILFSDLADGQQALANVGPHG